MRNAWRSGQRAAAALASMIVGLVPLQAQAVFTDVTAAAGLTYTQYSPVDPLVCLTAPSNFSCEIEVMTGGAATADVDGDGRPDLYVTRLDGPDILFMNQGGGVFADGTLEAGLAWFDRQTNGAGFADIDNDGDPDLYVTTVGLETDPQNSRFYLFINDGQGHFTEHAVTRGADVASAFPRGGFSVNFGDFDLDGWVDIHTSEWTQEVFTPGALPHTRLLRNLGIAGPGHFEDVTAAAGVQPDRGPGCVLGQGFCRSFVFSSTFADLDDDGWPDLAVAGDFGRSLLFWNDGDGTFTEGTAAAGVGTDENGMGSTFGDHDGDGDLDWFVTAIFDADETCEGLPCNWGYTGNRLYSNMGSRTFVDVTDTAGVRDGGWGWGAAFFDSDNDGDLDLTMTNGVDFPSTASDAQYTADAMRHWENAGSGVMAEQGAVSGLDDTGSGKGLLTFDYDLDGDLDVFVVNNGTGGKLLRNDGGNQNDWLRIELEGVASNRDGLGAKISVRSSPGADPQVQQVGARTHFLGQSERTAHFGLGAPSDDAVHEVVVTWPSGYVTTLNDIARNETIHVFEPVSPLPMLAPIMRGVWVGCLVVCGLGFARRGTSGTGRASI